MDSMCGEDNLLQTEPNQSSKHTFKKKGFWKMTKIKQKYITSFNTIATP